MKSPYKNNVIISTPDRSTNAYKPALKLQTKLPTTKDFQSSLPDAYTETAEQSYWAQSFGLLHKAAASSIIHRNKYAHPRRAYLQKVQASVVHQLVFGLPLYTEKTQPLLVVGGPRVTIHGTNSQSVLHRTLSRHTMYDNNNNNSKNDTALLEADRQISTTHLALAVAIRNDGRLVAVATDAGQIRLNDVTRRTTLATLTSRTGLPVRSVHWFRDGQRMLSAGDDAILRVWKLGNNNNSHSALPTPILELQGHSDVIHSTVLYESPTMTRLVTGSYDHTVRIWNGESTDGAVDESDDNNNRCLSILNHGAPVECLQLMESDNPDVPVWLLSVGGTSIKVWNILTGECVQHLQAKHRKTITCCLAIDKKLGDGSPPALRFWTAGLDSLIRVHSWDSVQGKLQHLHGITYSKPITALAVNQKSDRLAIGCVDGSIDVRQKGPSVNPRKRTRTPRAGTFAYFTRGTNSNPTAGDYVVENSGKKQKLSKYDQALKEFRYSDALDEALDTRTPRVVVAVLEELGKRRGLTIALSSRDEESLEPILSFLVRYIARPRFAPLLIGVSNILIDIYGSVAGESEIIDELFVKLKRQVQKEGQSQRQLLRIAGQLDMLIARALDDEG